MEIWIAKGFSCYRRFFVKSDLYFLYSFLFSNLSDSNRIRTHNHLVRKQALNHLVKLV